MKKLFTISIFFLVSLTFSQEIKDYTWQEKPKFETIPSEYKDQPAVVLFDKRWIHTRIGSYAFATFVMNHFAIKINKAEEINNYNKIKAEDNGYIRAVRDFHARIIKPNGDIKVLPQEKIIETEVNKEKSIVFEGVEAGDILEYYFILKENPNSYGVEIFQKAVPVLFAEFTTTSSGLTYDRYYSNNFKFSTNKDKSILTAQNLPPFVEERNAKNIKNLIKIIYETNFGAADTSDWKKYFGYFYKPSFSTLKKSDVKKYLAKFNFTTETTDEKLTKIDEFIKDNFEFRDFGEASKKIKVENTEKQKLSYDDTFSFYTYLLQELEINYQLVAGISRFIGEIDLYKRIKPLGQEFMIYIPETKKFLSPWEPYLSYGKPMFELQGSSGLSCNSKEKFTGDVFSFPIAPADYTVIAADYKVALTEDFASATINKTHKSSGYNGQILRATNKALIEEKDEKKTQEFLKDAFLDNLDAKIVKHSITNTEYKNNISNMPFTISLDVTLNQSIAESAGNLLVVNIGKVIGNQSDLYQETKRTQDVDLRYAKTYKHNIVFNIPDGYEVESLKDLQINLKTTTKNNQNASFLSIAKTEGNTVIIDLAETYESITYSLENYNEYRKIMNASADFTKANVVLKKKK